ncbi:MAG TPA: acylphosphatase [Egibacteraceae bacterium]|nr:acylphosphatase [Egibacteraceae bacterium]
MRRVRLIAKGLVQGVWFRASARDRAVALGLTGWVRNRPDGSVECEAQGDAAAVDAFVEFCRAGPGRAVVERLEVADLEPAEHATGFEVR